MGRPTSRWRSKSWRLGITPPGSSATTPFAGVVERHEQGAQLVDVRHAATAPGARRRRCGSGDALEAKPMAPAAMDSATTCLHASQLVGRGGPLVGVLAHDVHPHRGVAHVAPVVEGRCRGARRRRGTGGRSRTRPRARPTASVSKLMSSTCWSVRASSETRSGRMGAMEKPQLPGDHARHAVERRRRQPRVPEHLGVVVGVDVDEPGRDDLARGVELALAPTGPRPLRRCALPSPPRRRPGRERPCRRSANLPGSRCRRPRCPPRRSSRPAAAPHGTHASSQTRDGRAQAAPTLSAPGGSRWPPPPRRSPTPP